MSKKLRIGIVVVLVVLVIYIFYNQIVLGVIFSTPRKSTIELTIDGSTVYLETVSEGLSKVTKYVTTKNISTTSEGAIVFHNDLDIFYKVEGKTLVLLVRNEVDVSDAILSEIDIKMVELSNQKYMSTYDSYEQDGYQIF